MAEDIKELLEKHPFEPFVIVTSSGEKYLIEDLHGVALMTGRVFVAPRGEKWAFIKIGQITAIEAASKAA
ncbi:MAG: hypothetical protein FWD53_10570 [Phycisphaerales bacterium]|nr:hypothetical protein [Phycisphaerales bacterium]